MSERDARDPYLGLNSHIRQQARSQIPTYYTVGRWSPCGRCWFALPE